MHYLIWNILAGIAINLAITLNKIYTTNPIKANIAYIIPTIFLTMPLISKAFSVTPFIKASLLQFLVITICSLLTSHFYFKEIISFTNWCGFAIGILAGILMIWK